MFPLSPHIPSSLYGADQGACAFLKKGDFLVKTIYFAGDSTASIKTENVRPEMGWGEELVKRVEGQFIVKNYAVNGRSSKSFIEEGRLAQIEWEIQAKDILLIQFGHNDFKPNDPTRHTEPDDEFKSNLKKYIDVARSQDAFPILLTPTTRRVYRDEQLDHTLLEEYRKAIYQVAEKEDVPLIDIFTHMQNGLNKLAQEETKSFFLYVNKGESENYPDGKDDDTHLNPNGARLVTTIFIDALNKLKLNYFHIQ